ncbi:MAG: AraC family transcriptional regulator [Spirochaetales bacterium]|nr:AraC family transcriptional regulator [Spirochaetales bacterium]
MLKHEIVIHEESFPALIKNYRARDYFISSHWHTHLEIILIQKGTMEVLSSHEKVLLKEREIVIINSGEIHQTRVFGDTETLLLQVPFSLISDSLSSQSSRRFVLKPKEGEARDILVALLDELGEVYREKGEGQIFLFRSLLQKVLYHLVVDWSDPVELSESARRHMTRMQGLLNYLEENYAFPLSVRDGAEIMGQHRDYFCRFFKKNTGSTFMEYLNLIRLTHIHRDLVSTENRVSEILERHGFTNYKVFSRLFKEHYGMTPSELRRKQAG